MTERAARRPKLEKIVKPAIDLYKRWSRFDVAADNGGLADAILPPSRPLAQADKWITIEGRVVHRPNSRTGT
jgi:hypothetical protein